MLFNLCNMLPSLFANYRCNNVLWVSADSGDETMSES